VGRFLYHLTEEGDAELKERLNDQLTDHHDGVSVPFRPLVKDAEKKSAPVKPWQEPGADDPI